MKPPIPWFGGKYILRKKLLPLIPPHQVYVEPFGGAAGLLFAKPPSPVEVYNDLDTGLVNFFRVLRDPQKFRRFQQLVWLTPYSREEYIRYRATWNQTDDEVERAYRWFVVIRMGFSGQFGSGWSYGTSRSCRGMAECVSRWLSTIAGLPEVHQRLTRVQIDHRDFRDVFQAYDSQETFFYVDPPYVLATRDGRGYTHNLSDGDHEELVAILLGLKGMAMVSGYQHPLYAPLESAGWSRHEFAVGCHAVGKTSKAGLKGAGTIMSRAPRTEMVWLSPRNLRQQQVVKP